MQLTYAPATSTAPEPGSFLLLLTTLAGFATYKFHHGIS